VRTVQQEPVNREVASGLNCSPGAIRYCPDPSHEVVAKSFIGAEGRCTQGQMLWGGGGGEALLRPLLCRPIIN
jgi:hypothetical protein